MRNPDTEQLEIYDTEPLHFPGDTSILDIEDIDMPMLVFDNSGHVSLDGFTIH